jgi:phospholipase C
MSVRLTALWLALALVWPLATTGCANIDRPDSRADARLPARLDAFHAKPQFQHVVFIIQENRSFDNLFHGYPGANTASSGKLSNGQTVRLVPIPLEGTYDIAHGAGNFVKSTDGGKMDGFDQELIEGNGSMYRHPQYGFVPHDETTLYFAIAHSYVLGDNAFPSNLDASYVAHQYAIAAQADSAVDLPPYYGCNGEKSNTIQTWTQDRQYGPPEETCRNYQTLGDELDAASRSWRYYTYNTDDWLWTGYGSVKHIRFGDDWHKVVAPQTKIFADIAAGKLADVTWVTPSDPESDHAGSLSKLGPQWVASLVNAIGTSKYWNSTAIFVMWDEWGGWYDHVPPPYEDYDGLGIRVPFLVISPYAKRDYVTHVQYETGSVLRFIENQYGLAPLSASDSRANDPLLDCFDLSQPPRRFVPFTVNTHPGDFVRADAAAPGPPDSE